jgi:integral membrane sensor domain MASE1
MMGNTSSVPKGVTMGFLDLPLVASVRRNHAIEHAAMHMLAQRQPYLNAVGRTVLDGFYVYGNVDTQTLADAVAVGLARLQAGETNLAGMATFLVMGGSKSRLSKFPRFVLAATLAVIAAQPLGLLVQERVTTSTDVSTTRIRQVTRQQEGRLTVHKVELEHYR